MVMPADLADWSWSISTTPAGAIPLSSVQIGP